MRARVITRAVLGVFVVSAPVALAGQGVAPTTPQPVPAALAPASDALKVAEARVAAARAKLDESQKRVDTGVATAQELREAKVALEEANANLAEARRRAEQEKVAAALQERVTVNINDQPLRSAVRLLTDSARLTIRVDNKVPDPRVTLRADNVPLESILDAIGEQTGLTVEREPLGFVFKEQPSLAIGGSSPYSPERAKLFESMERAVDVQMRDATVSQAAESLSKASGIPITVDKAVTTEKRVTAEAHGVPMRAVLEAIVRQLDLMIAPSGDSKGIVLKPWPSMEVNGTRTVLAGMSAPWSEEWGNVPAIGVMRLFRLGSGAGTVVAPPGPANGTTSIYRQWLGAAPAGLAGAGPLALTASGNLVIVAEPGPGGRGERGFWLTVYRLDGSNLQKVGSTFHRSPEAPRNAPAPGGAGAGAAGPNFGGLGGFGGGGFGGGGFGGGFPGGGFGDGGISGFGVGGFGGPGGGPPGPAGSGDTATPTSPALRVPATPGRPPSHR